MMRYLALVIGLCGLSLVAVILLSPSPEEKLERAMSRLSPALALTELNRMYIEGDRSPSLLLRRAELLLASGDFDAARQTLESLAASPQNTLVAVETLARIELDLGNVTAATRHAARAYGIEPTPERLAQFARLLELTGNTGAELVALATADPATLEDRSARRLLELLVLRADMTRVERLLRVRAEVGSESRASMRGSLVELLVGSDRADEATELAATWFSRDLDSTALALATERLIERGFLRHAQVLGRATVESDLLGSHVVVPVFAAAGHGLLARSLLQDWLAKHPYPSTGEAESLLEYATTMNDFSAMRALFHGGGGSLNLDATIVMGVLKGNYLRFGPAALPEFRRYMTPDVLASDPLFAAEISFAQGRPADASHYLERAAEEDLRPWESDSWETLVRRLTAGPLRDRLFRARAAHTSPPVP